MALGGGSGLAVYDMAALSLQTALGDISAPVLDVAFSPDGRYLAYSTQDGRLLLRDTLSGTTTPLVNPANAFENAGDIARSLKATKDTFVSKGTDIVNTVDHAVDQTVQQGGKMISSGLDTGKKALEKGGDVVDSVVNFVF
jgi:WD40 repeat protein